ncbi:DUF3127 domain-containing protein [Candidatus Shikimatogenerans bostrichidophilus]|uniref:DUF3127 domain-containing protein n=1 Tax=Candidatus Shikimatogenerans bostrichidophilus TaxID=2943807 RepID=UPI002967539D
MYLIGKINKIFDIQIFKNNFKKRSIILETEELYPQKILIEFIQDKIDLLKFININDKVKIYINIRGKEWKNKDGITKYINSIQCWKIESIEDNNNNNKF